MAELADAPDLGSGSFGCGGSSPPSRTTPGPDPSMIPAFLSDKLTYCTL
jgi:hypothetical protein